jgi:Flp pilus assembly pilin Flp
VPPLDCGGYSSGRYILNRILCAIGLQVAGLNRGLSLKREEGQTLVEYALIIVTISIGVTGAMVFLRGQIRSVFSDIGNAL